MSAVVGRLSPALAAGRPWGSVAPAGSGPGVAPAATTPPNQSLLDHFSLLCQWHAPALGAALQRGSGVGAALMRPLSCAFATAADAPALLRLLDILLLGQPEPALLPLLLLALLLRPGATLTAVPPSELAATVASLRLRGALDAQRLHDEARALLSATPHGLRGALAAASGGRPVPPAYACAPLEAPEVLGGLAALTPRVWVLDVRSDDEFAAASFPLTVHLPPAALADAGVRGAARDQLAAVCGADDGVLLAVLTSGDPLSVGGCSGAAPDLVKLAIHEIVRDGVARVGVLRGGFAALTADHKQALVQAERGGDGGGDGGGGGGVTARAKDAAALAKAKAAEAKAKAAEKAAEVKGRMMSFGRRRER